MKSVQYISKDAGARARSASATRRRTTLLGTNPLPNSFRLVPDGPRRRARDRRPRSRRAGADGGPRKPALAGIDEVRNREQDTDKILSATSLVKVVTAGMAALLILASIALIANTIRLSIFARRREVEVMKLVGATNWFIRWPFVIEGVIVGFFGGVLAVLLLAIAQGDVRRPAGGQLRAARRAEHDRLPGC